MKIAIWGSGGHGGVVLDSVRLAGVHELVAIFDDKDGGEPIHRTGVPIVYGRRNLKQLRAAGVNGIVIAIGDESTRCALAAVAVEFGFELCTVIHPSAVVCADVSIGVGTVIFAGALVQTGTAIGDNAVINTGASVDHDCLIGRCSQLAPRVALGGRVEVGDLSFIGIGASLINGVTVGRNCVIGAGAVVVRDVPDHSVAYGVPARLIRERQPA